MSRRPRRTLPVLALCGGMVLVAGAAVAGTEGRPAAASPRPLTSAALTPSDTNCATIGLVQTVKDPTNDLLSNVLPVRPVHGYADADITQVQLARSSQAVCVDVRTQAPPESAEAYVLNLRSTRGVENREANTAPAAEVSFGRAPGYGWVVELSDGLVGQVRIKGSVRLTGSTVSLVFATSELRSYISLKTFQWSVETVVAVPHTGSTEIYDCAPDSDRHDATYPAGTSAPKISSYCVL